MNPLDDLAGESPAIEAVRRDVRRLLSTLAGKRLPSVLIEGETGTGKGLVARILHSGGPRSDGPFVDVNCAAIPETLLEAELFGFERGAFTDARRSKPGLFHAAHRGAIFLDEVGLLADGLQAKLLSVLEERSVRRLGAVSAEPVDVWVLSATNSDLRAAMRERRFREDLYHRLAVLTLRLPPLRERGRDVLLLAERFLVRACQEYGLEPKHLAPDAETRLLAYRWPGNVRELGNVMERVALLSAREVVSADMLEIAAEPPRRDADSRGATLSARQAAREHLREALERTGWNISHTAAALGVARNTVRARIQRYRLERRPEPPLPAPPSAATPTAPPAPASSPAPTAREHGRGALGAPGLRWSRRRVVFLRLRVSSGLDSRAAAPARFLDRCVEKVLGFGGRLDEMGRRGFLATFGTEPAEDAPRRAANVALVIRNLLGREQAPDDAPGVMASIALHAHRSLVAQIGPRLEIDQDDLSEVRRALDELEPLGEGEITASEAAAKLLGAHVELRRRGTGGRSGYTLGTLDPRVTPATTFVGRGRDIDALTSRLERALEGHGQVVSIVGEPGIGKSRVVREFLHTITADTAHTVTGRCTVYGVHVPYFPLVEMLTATLDPGAPGAPYLEALLDPRRTAALGATSPESVKAHTFDAIRQVVLTQQAQRPLVMVVEDLHWSDPTSVEFLAELVDVIVNQRVLLVTTSRPGLRVPWGGRSHVTQLTLDPLSESDARTLIASVLDMGAPGSEALATTILTRAEGNPFFLEELARTLRSGDEPRLAVTIHDAIAARIDALPESDRELLQLCAVVGRDVALPVLERAWAGAGAVVHDGLARLQTLEFLHPMRFDPAPEYAFKHALTCDAAYESIPDDERAALHERVARAIEAIAPDTGERRPHTLGRHYAAAGRTREAVEYLRRAGELALRRSANAEAIAHLEQALALLPKESPDADTQRAEVQVLLALASALVAHRGFGSLELENTLSRLRAATGRAGHGPELTPVRFSLWRFALARAEFDTAEHLVTELHTAADRTKEPGAVAAAHAAAGMTAFYLGRLADARRSFEEVVARHDPERERAGALVYGQDLGVGPLGYLGWTQTLMGQCDLGAETAEQALARAREGNHPFTIAHALNVGGLVRCDRREPVLVARHGEEMLALAREGRFTFLTSLALMLVGWSRLALGDREGVELLRQGYDLYRAAHQRVGLRPPAQLAEALLAIGEVDAALDVAEQALADARVTRDGIYRSEVLRVKGEALARRAPDDAVAMMCLQEAVDVATRQGAWLLALRAACSLVRARPASGADVPARRLLRTIYDRFTEGHGLADLRAADELLSAGA